HFSSESNPLPALTERVWDKLLHVIEYGGLGLLACRASLGEGARWKHAVLVAILISSAYGVTDEWHEAVVPLRTPDGYDWIADTVGAAIGAAAYLAAPRAAGSAGMS